MDKSDDEKQTDQGQPQGTDETKGLQMWMTRIKNRLPSARGTNTIRRTYSVVLVYTYECFVRRMCNASHNRHYDKLKISAERNRQREIQVQAEVAER